VHPDLKILIELQQVDRNISELTSKIDSSPHEIQALKEQLNEFTRTLDERKARLSANQKERRDLEGDLQTIRAKISRHKDQLYEVKTNEQYRAMLKEIEGEEENIRKVEDRILEKMVEAEQIDKLIREASGRLDSEKARVQNEIARLEALRRESEQARSQLQARRQELAGSLSGETLGLYEKLRKARNGMALAEVRDGLCTGCHVRLRPQAYNDVRSSDLLLTCETCSRILYYIPHPESAAGDEMTADQRAALQN
jgi:predicted  nucleic acid-binding Zn-ribbon protein